MTHRNCVYACIARWNKIRIDFLRFRAYIYVSFFICILYLHHHSRHRVYVNNSIWINLIWYSDAPIVWPIFFLSRFTIYYQKVYFVYNVHSTYVWICSVFCFINSSFLFIFLVFGATCIELFYLLSSFLYPLLIDNPSKCIAGPPPSFSWLFHLVKNINDRIRELNI